MMRSTIVKVHVPKSEAFRLGKDQFGTVDFPVDPKLLLELRPWERTWLAERLRQGALPHGLRGGKWQHSPLQADPLWDDGPELVSTQQIAHLIRERMQQCSTSEQEHLLSVELCSKWLSRFHPNKLPDLHAGTLRPEDVAKLRQSTLLRTDAKALVSFQPLQAREVPACCEHRSIKFSSEPYGGEFLDEVDLNDDQWDSVMAIHDALVESMSSGPWMSGDEFGEDSLCIRLRRHIAWCDGCDKDRARAVSKLGLVATLEWGPMRMEREYEMGGAHGTRAREDGGKADGSQGEMASNAVPGNDLVRDA
jgi:hypothetical protein